jgi:hypothetical protein
MLVNAGPDPYGASREHARDGACAAVGQARAPGIDGSALSSAILYLAIVAIWAVVLVPRWLRPRHTTSRTLESQLTEPPGHRQLEDFAWTDEDEADQDGYAGSFGEADLVRAETGTGWPGPGVAGPAGRRGPEREHEAVAAGPPAPPAAPTPQQDDGP